ncbi:MAG: hypothetical protein WC551_12100 [Patescibacteria group bacterium]
MQEPQKKLAGPKPQEAPAPAKPFAGRSALISGLLGAAEAYEKNPSAVTDKQELESLQILQSRQIFETILDIVSTRTNISNYREALIVQAQAIADKRMSARETAQQKTARDVPSGRPATKRDALNIALAQLGLDATITAEKETDGKSMFTVECMGMSNRVPLNNSIMELDDPVDKVRLILSFIALGQTDEDRRVKRLEERRSTRPPPTPLGIDSRELDGRMVTFDGQFEHCQNGKWILTYVAKGMETSFSFDSGATGEDLLDMIDERIDMLHREYGKPFPVPVLEWRSKDRAGKAYMEGVPSDILGIACTLDYLATCPARMRDLVPAEYVEGFDALKKLPPPHSAFLTTQDMDGLKEALDSLDHPIHAILREAYGTESIMLNSVAQEEVLSLLSLSPSVAVDVCDAAVNSIAQAYTLISNDNMASFAKPDELRKMYLRLMFSVRRAINEAVADGSLEVDS